ncbi:hypothetical protein [Aquimarina sediminis]|uniref:hypothetical protein n=1 Tax=Aquimarina sediminis TaxID=2070536 RepID=UPI000CA03CF0|nr:hypothetical protein [Aquimarina sediminis]
MSKIDYQNKLIILKEIDTKDIRTPNIPIDIYLQEAEDLYLWVLDDKEALLKINLDWKHHVEDLTARAGALRHAQAIWVNRKNGQEKPQKLWKEKLLVAKELRAELLADFRYAYRNQKNALSAIRAIAKGNSFADLIQDLSNLDILGKSYPTELEHINFDVQKLDLAGQLSSEIAKLLALANNATAQNSNIVKIRNQAYTHLKESVDEIRNAGKYIFRNNPNRFKGYISRHRKA